MLFGPSFSLLQFIILHFSTSCSLVSFSPAYKKPPFICDCLIFSSQFILTANDKIIAFVTVAAGTAADQLTVKFSDSEKI